ncbi:hypothetical protein TSUD_22700 [Trifolium subterraneum]|uniref:Uncharacterized protein n=1 Tax=Trifolium subterraneum TaxID=3900 RepID=A0A2Z6MZC8_TRISU|nr:hypothetical protein TSUD_22700 [Trifolium subterraneum]
MEVEEMVRKEPTTTVKPFVPKSAPICTSDNVSCWSDPHETSDIACSSKRISQDDPAKKLDKDGTPPNKELCDPVVKFAAVSSALMENHNPDEGSIDGDTQAPNTSSQSSHPETKPKENPTGKKKYVRRTLNKTSAPPAEITGELTTEKMPELAKPPCKSYTNTSSKRKPHRAKPKEGPITKTQYMRRSRLNKSSTPTEVSRDLPEKMMPESSKTSCQKSLNFDGGARDESSADRENATANPCKETGAAMQEIEVDLGYDMETFMKQAAENNYLPFCKNKQTPTERPCEETGAVMWEIDVCLQMSSTSPSKTHPPGKKQKENLTGNKYQRRKRLNKSPTCQTEMTGEQTGEMMPESKETPMRRFSDFDMGAKDESSGHKEIVNVEMGNVVEETRVGLAYNNDIWIKVALNSYKQALPEDAQAPNTDPSKDNPPGEKPEENPNGKRKRVKKKRSKMTSTPREMTGELTEPIMSEPTIISCRMSINFDNGGRDESNMCSESLASDQNTLVKEMSNNHMSLSENTQAPSTCLPKSNPPEEKRNASNKNKRKGLVTAEDGNISYSQISTIKSQMDGCEREHSGTTELADNNSLNLIGAHYNGLH